MAFAASFSVDSDEDMLVSDTIKTKTTGGGRGCCCSSHCFLTAFLWLSKRPFASTNFCGVVFDLLKILCASMHGMFWDKNFCWQPKESVKIVLIH